MDGHGLYRGLTNYGDREFARYLRRSFSHSTGRSAELLDRPVVGIATSTSDFNKLSSCSAELVEAVKRGVLAAGGLPMEFPTISLGEGFLHPTAMMFRNLMAIGCGGAGPRPADGRGRARRRLRQDRARAADGGGQRGAGRRSRWSPGR